MSTSILPGGGAFQSSLEPTTRCISALSVSVRVLISGSNALIPLGQPGGAGWVAAVRSEGEWGTQRPAGIHDLKNTLSFKII